MYYTIYDSPLGEIAITASEQGLTALAFQQGASPIAFNENDEEMPDKFADVVTQLNEYFNGQRTSFELTLAPQGTPFQKKVWQALCQIPCGKTVSYGWIAKKIGNEKAVRAVGTANGANPIALIVPCHRVIGSNQKLTGYAGGLALKAKLLMHEGADFKV
ncbi:methylated-DNA--[protein]-cysteine S-methyltransferase [Thalassotalea atypica]|uniref:methylated-DNA--[protein]-cysteine S-methyltransferase n=1 Tax=Thalassotalea atypica TaxID=2054316 RepID=UPI002572635E|nr:methylated-DNA--[protein]-cysteine S-methyltransferase [Thalassotalea atypica]